MATYWVRAGGNDANTGLSFAQARLTLPSIVAKMVSDAAAKNSVCNILNDQTYTWPTSETSISTGLGTSFTDFGYLFRGVSDSLETPAKVTIAATGGDAVRRIAAMAAGSGYHIWRNIVFDASAKTADASTYTAIRFNNAGGPVWMDGCHMIGAAAGGVSLATMGVRQIVNIQTSNANLANSRVWYCLLQNVPAALPVVGAAIALSVHDCIEYIDGTGATGSSFLQRSLAAGSGAAFDVYSNTIYRLLNQASTTPIACSVAGTNFGVMGIHSNLVYIESTLAGNADVEFLHDSTGGSVPWSGTIGYNGLFGGPNVPVGDLNAFGWYRGTFTTGGNPKATDQVAYGVAEATLFNNPATTYAWNALGNGVTLTVPKDLRPRLYLTSSLAGGVLGALPAASTDYGVTIDSNNTAPLIGDTVVLTVTASNTGTSATGVTMTAAIPAGMTLVSSAPGVGSYNSGTGLWTIGSLASGGSVTLILTATVDMDQAGNIITVTASTTSGDPANDTNSANNTDSVDMVVVAPPTENPSETPFLDVAPIFAPVLLAEINAILRTKRNRLSHHEQRSDIERHKWHEYTSRRITLAPSATMTVTSSIERISHALIEADGDIQVSAANDATDTYFPNVRRLALLNGYLTTLKLKNPGTASVEVLLVVID